MQELKLVKNLIDDMVKSCADATTTKLMTYVSQGKMLRSKLILKIAGIDENSLKLCAIVEMIHLASLLHDDVIDKSNTRRGKPSINALFDNKTSIMLGDILYSKAFSQLTTMDSKIAKTISEAVVSLSIGELADIELAKTFNTSYDKYYDMIYKKTASLIEASAKSAGMLLGEDGEDYAIYGKNLGLAFQMIDDILDITQDSKTLGKPAMLDFVEGKVTIPYLLLFETLENKDKLQNMANKELSKDEKTWIKTQMIKTKALEKSIIIARKLGLEALEAIRYKNNSSLENIMNDMIERDF